MLIDAKRWLRAGLLVTAVLVGSNSFAATLPYTVGDVTDEKNYSLGGGLYGDPDGGEAKAPSTEPPYDVNFASVETDRVSAWMPSDIFQVDPLMIWPWWLPLFLGGK